MELLIKQGEKWFDNEDKKLIHEYQEEKLDIKELSKLHQRTRGAIKARLKRLGLINNEITENSYDEYKNSEIYKDVCEHRKERYNGGIKKEKNKNNILITIEKNNYETLQSNLETINEDINELYRKFNFLDKKLDKIIDLLEKQNNSNNNSENEDNNIQYIEIKNIT